METQVRTPNSIFGHPQRFLVPLFQRPYVWNEELQWEPLWADLVRVATRLLQKPDIQHPPHFLGAVVLQQVQSRTGDLPERTVIDGQQRLTTLQILLDALHAQLIHIGENSAASRLEYLVTNDERFRKTADDRFKVSPTNRDRPAFNEVMAATPPVDYASLEHKNARLVHAHRYFSEQAAKWLICDDSKERSARASAIEVSARELLQIVVIDLTADENAQEIFETLNARGAQLTAADLIKNFVFQKLRAAGADVEHAYETHWKEFETAFWETEVSAGRVKHQRSSLFINHWLISRTGEAIVAREVFTRFKTFADHDAQVPITDLLQQMARAAKTYRTFTEAADNLSGPIDELGLFSYRLSVLEIDVMKSVLLALLDAERPPLSETVLYSALGALESWLMRRMLTRAETNVYNQIAAELVNIIRQSDPTKVDQAIRSFLMNQSSENRHWPDDDEIKAELRDMPIYRRISRSRLRMVLESLEDHQRGYKADGQPFAGMRVPRAQFHIEHLMPQSWEAKWQPPTNGNTLDRAHRSQKLGNLTLLTRKLNSSVSNGSWTGPTGKRQALTEKDVLLLNRDIDKLAADTWSDETIEERTRQLIEQIVEVWPVPAGYKSAAAREIASTPRSVEIDDLLFAEMLKVGQVLTPRTPEYRQRTATVLPGGRIECEGRIFDSPSGTGYHLRKRATNGWYFWLVDPATRKSLADVRREYLESMTAGRLDLDSEDLDQSTD